MFYRRKISAKDAAYLRGEDIAICQRCGSANIAISWPIENGITKYENPTGVICFDCLWHCGEETLFSSIAAKIAFWRIRRRERKI